MTSQVKALCATILRFQKIPFELCVNVSLCSNYILLSFSSLTKYLFACLFDTYFQRIVI